MMTNINENVIAEAEDRSQNLLVEELVKLIERYHPHEKSGVSRETIAQYSEALAGGAEDSSNIGAFDETVNARLTDAETWQGDGALYALGDDRVSIYPAQWHDALSGSTDIREYIRFLRDDAENFEKVASRGTGYGIPESTLLNIVAVVGQVDHEAVKARVEELRDGGEITEEPDQHPDARVRLAD